MSKQGRSTNSSICSICGEKMEFDDWIDGGMAPCGHYVGITMQVKCKNKHLCVLGIDSYDCEDLRKLV